MWTGRCLALASDNREQPVVKLGSGNPVPESALPKACPDLNRSCRGPEATGLATRRSLLKAGWATPQVESELSILGPLRGRLLESAKAVWFPRPSFRKNIYETNSRCIRVSRSTFSFAGDAGCYCLLSSGAELDELRAHRGVRLAGNNSDKIVRRRGGQQRLRHRGGQRHSGTLRELRESAKRS